MCEQLSQTRACDQLNLKPVLMDPLGLINNYLKTNHKMRALKGRLLVSPGREPWVWAWKKDLEPYRGDSLNLSKNYKIL